MSSTIVGQKAPAFELEAVKDGKFVTISSEELEGRWTVLFFYPLDFTFVCPTEILAFSDRLDEFEKLGATVLGVSVDSKFTHLAWTERPRSQGGIQGLRYPLISDFRRSLSRDFGVLADAGVALRGLFIIDPDGIVQHATVNNLGIGRSVDETLRVLQAAQHHRKHGEVCPANWHPGEAGMKADWHASKEWFAKQLAAK